MKKDNVIFLSKPKKVVNGDTYTWNGHKWVLSLPRLYTKKEIEKSIK